MPAKWTSARKNAHREGRKRFIGNPCPKGHRERFTSSGECCACHDVRAKSFRESNGKGIAHHRVKTSVKVRTIPRPRFVAGVTLEMAMAGK